MARGNNARSAREIAQVGFDLGLIRIRRILSKSGWRGQNRARYERREMQKTKKHRALRRKAQT